MKLLILAIAVACAHAHPAHDQAAQVVRSSYDLSPEGSYAYAYETSNGIIAQQEGAPDGQSEYPSIAAKGSYKYTSPEGEVIEIQYTADQNGYQPQGSHVPPIPDYIARSLEYIAAHPPPPRS